MRVLLDACVIFPTVMREMLIGLAQEGLYEPFWSERIIAEWTRAASRLGDGADAIARAEAAVMCDAFPSAMVPPGSIADIWLPDPDDVHVLEAAILGQADVLMTKNLGDFPTRILSSHGVLRRDPDGFMIELLETHPAIVKEVAKRVQTKAERLSQRDQAIRGLLKRSGLPRLGKALA